MTILYTSIGHRKNGKSRHSFHELFINILLRIVWKIFVIYDTEKSKQLYRSLVLRYLIDTILYILILTVENRIPQTMWLSCIYY